MSEYSSVWPELCRVWSQIKWRFLCEISGKNHFKRIFQKFSANQGYPLAEWRYWEEKPRRFVFGKLIFFTLGLGLIAPYSLGILVWNFYQTFVIVSIEFWLRFESQTCPTRLAINFLIITVGLKGMFVCVWNCLIVFLGEYSSVWPEFCHFLSQIQWRFLHGISRKNHFGRIFQKFCANHSSKTCEISPYSLQFFSGSVLRWKNSHKYFLMFFAPR